MLLAVARSRVVTTTPPWCILRAMPRRTATTDDILVPLRGPSGEPVDLWRALVSHGFHELAPVALDEQARTLSLTLRMPRGKPRRVTIGQGPRRSALVTTAGS